MKRITLIAAAMLAAAAIAPGSAQPRPKIDVPIWLGGDSRRDACGATGIIVGLDPKGDGFLSVRSGPGGQPYQEIDRLYNGNRVYICGRQGPWHAVVYSDNPNNACGVMDSWPVRQPYTGPCRYGWIHSRYVKIIAG